MAIQSVSDFVEIILKRSIPKNSVVCYRGHGSVDYTLTPSIFRKQATKENEHVLLRELIAAHPEDFNGDTSALEKLDRMQHYSLPTRLLDVTFNPLVALYFSCETVKKRTSFIRAGKKTTRTDEKDGNLVILTVPQNTLAYFDSDKVSCLANLAQLSWSYKQNIDTDIDIENFNKTKPIKRLLHFIRQEKNGFLPEIEAIIYLTKQR